jgi:hypothetical protein
MRNRLMISAAAIALIAGAGLANAQGGMKNESGGASMQRFDAAEYAVGRRK